MTHKYYHVSSSFLWLITLACCFSVFTIHLSIENQKKKKTSYKTSENRISSILLHDKQRSEINGDGGGGGGHVRSRSYARKKSHQQKKGRILKYTPGFGASPLLRPNNVSKNTYSRVRG